MTSLGRMSRADLDALSSLNPVQAALTLRAALFRAPAVCAGCGIVSIVEPRCSTSYAGHCPECGGPARAARRIMNVNNATKEAGMDAYVVFDGPPSHASGRFIEVEDGHGHGLGASQCPADWRERKDGYWELGPFLSLTDRERAALQLVARERSVDRSGAAWEEPLLQKFTEDEWTALAKKLAPPEP